MVKKIKLLILVVIVFAVAGGAVYFGKGFFYGAKTIHELLTENKHLKQAITNLTEEGQIGYAKVVGQEKRAGRVYTTIRFVETAREDSSERILERDYVIEGDIVHFDAVIVKFTGQMVLDGEEQALYLWRRVYGEYRAASEGFVIEQPGGVPRRYEGLFEKLNVRERQMFWENIWSLANDPDRLKEYGIQAVYGNAIYSRLKPGLIYVFKITSSGQVYPEVIRQM